MREKGLQFGHSLQQGKESPIVLYVVLRGGKVLPVFLKEGMALWDRRPLPQS